MSFHSFTEEHACFSSVLRFAGELVQSPNPTINEFGTIVYKHLFYNLSSDRKTVLTYLSKHLGEVDSETTAALSVLQEIAVERIEILRNFVDDLKCQFIVSDTHTYSYTVFLLFCKS
uniref:Uncharacterized protein n=1 Tax=Panagrolaimus davidi TaxID=227884 RepID=A0A914QFH2_9BILA